MKRHWLLIGAALLTAALAIGAVACNDDDDDGAAPTATEAAGEEPAATEAPSAQATVIVTENATLGAILTDAEGNTLYIFDNDEPGVSNCAEGCVENWPPLTVDGEPTAGDGVTGTLSTIKRDDGTTQVTYDDQPLYHFSGDTAPGDTNGDGVLEIWHVVSVGG
ncbi:MAG: hypothetical protein HY723_02515 [Chloroflexi bacterium]|nr:hypothetical protein [Chloroflexota bacterium]